MRILDCKVDRDKEAVKHAPRITDYLNDESKAYYELTIITECINDRFKMLN
jgi:histidyl-tRNA synthetase